MTLPKKQSRALVHDGARYRWKVGKRALRHAHPEGSTHGLLHLELPLLIEHEESGAMIAATFHGLFALALPSAGFQDVQDLALSPGAARCVLTHALETLDWRPDTSSAPLRLDHAEQICPDALDTTRFESLERGYDPAKLDHYLQDTTFIWERC